MQRELFIAVLGNLLTALLTFVLVMLPALSNKRRKLRFFGFDAGHKNLVVYLSGVKVDAADSERSPTDLITGFTGTLVGKLEAEAASLVTKTLLDTWLGYFDIEWTDLSGSVAPHIRKVNVDVRISPNVNRRSSTSQLTCENTFCIGSHLFNSATRHYQDRLSCFFRFIEREVEGGEPELCVEVRRGGQRGEVFAGRSVGKRELAVIQRLRNPDRPKHIVFICAGTGQRATNASVRHLLSNWEMYSRKYEDRDFGVCLQFLHDDGNWDDLTDKVVCELSVQKNNEVLPIEAMNQIDKQQVPKELRFPDGLPLADLTPQHALISPSLRRAAAAFNDRNPRLSKIAVKYDTKLGLGPFWFDLLAGPCMGNEETRLTLPYKAFCELLFLDLGRWKSGIDFARHIRSEYSDRMMNSEEGTLFSACDNWFSIYKGAAEEFFEQGDLAAYFRLHVSSWWNSDIEQSKNHAEYKTKIEEHISLRNRAALELGCGYGRFAGIFSGASRSVHVDASAVLLEQAEKACKRKKAEFINERIENLSSWIGDQSFDCIVLLQVCMHLRNPFEVIREAKSLLNRNGEIWVDFTCEANVEAPWSQESFFTRIYRESYVIEQIEQLGLDICLELRTEDRPGHYWLTLKLKEGSKRETSVPGQGPSVRGV